MNHESRGSDESARISTEGRLYSQTKRYSSIDNDYFVVNSSKLLSARDLTAVLRARKWTKADGNAKWIRKGSNSYLRLGLAKRSGAAERTRTLDLLRNKFKAEVRQLKGEVDPNWSPPEYKPLRNISVMTLNINNLGKKLIELQMLIERTLPTIICLQETRRGPGRKKLYLPGYRISEVPADPDTGGVGLLIGVRADANLIVRMISTSTGRMTAIVTAKEGSLLLMNIYGKANSQLWKQTALEIAKDLESVVNKETFIGAIAVGDWNRSPEDIEKCLRKLGTQVFIESCPKFGTRLNSGRRRTKRPIDFGASTTPGLISEHKVIRWACISDHLPVVVEINFQCDQRPKREMPVFLRNRLKTPEVKKGIREAPAFNPVGDNGSPELFKTALNEVLSSVGVLSLRTVREIVKKIPRPIRKLIVSKRGVSSEVARGVKPLSDYKVICNNIKKAIYAWKRREYLCFIQKGIDVLKASDMRRSWSWIRKASGALGRSSAATLVIKDPMSGEAAKSPGDALKIWVDHFENLAKIPEKVSKVYYDQINDQMFDYSIFDRPLEWGEVTREMKATMNGKAAGLDGVPSDVYKLVQDEPTPQSCLSRAIFKVLSNVFESGSCPDVWKCGVVVPVPKKGDPSDVNNYRGITLISTMLKLLCKIIARRIQEASEIYPLIRREQTGFARLEECTGQVACLVEMCQRRMYTGLKTFACFLDLKKAYDMVPHDKLLMKLRKKGLGQKTCSFIESLYTDSWLRVRVGQSLSEKFEYKRGVRQGCPTSPVLFNLFIDDLLDPIDPIYVPGLSNGIRGLMFADDTVIFADSPEELTSKLSLVKAWMVENDMEVNPSKCGVMVIGEQEPPDDLIIIYDNELIPVVDAYTYLGVEINPMLDLGRMSKFRVAKGVKAAAVIDKMMGNLLVPLEYKKMLLSGFLIPVLMYGSELFGMNESRLTLLKGVLDNSIKRITKKHSYCRVRAYEELDLKPLATMAAMSRARAIYKWRDSKGIISDLLASAQSFKNRKKTWACQTLIWLKRFKISLDMENLKELKKSVLNNCGERSRKRDKSKISSISRALNIKSGKILRKAQLKFNVSPVGLDALIRIRMGSFQFTNELIRKGKIPSAYNDKCICCGSKVKEDPEHLIMNCQAFKESRERLIPCLKSKDYKLNHLLGGGSPASGGKPNAVLELIKYLATIVRRRAAVIAAIQRAHL